MTRFEFIEELRLRLAVLSEEERTDALQFYEEYFEDAGPENEQAVIAELGSPAALAERILSGEGKASVWKNGRDTYGQSASGNGGYREFASRKAGQPAYAAGAQQKKHSGWMALAIILIVLGSPIWLSVLFAIFICIVAAVMTVGAVFLAVLCVIVALVIICIACLGVGLWMMPRDMLNGLFVFSIGLMGMGGALVLVPLGALCINKGFPALGRGIAHCWHGVAGWCGSVWHKMKGGAER